MFIIDLLVLLACTIIKESTNDCQPEESVPTTANKYPRGVTKITWRDKEKCLGEDSFAATSKAQFVFHYMSNEMVKAS